jgi:opacity protein-like surface antigen
LKRTLFLTTVAATLASLLIPAARAQVTSEPENAPPPAAAPSLRYEVTAGYGYSTINQLNQSRYGLQGVEVSAARYWGKYFAVVVLGDDYKWATSKGNPGNPSIYSFLAGPQFRMNIFGPVDGFFRGTMGGEHTGGENETPNISFAGGIGGGIDIGLNRRFAVRISGDRIGASFSLSNNSPSLAYSPHLTWNTRAAIGVLYRF